MYEWREIKTSAEDRREDKKKYFQFLYHIINIFKFLINLFKTNAKCLICI
jgi:hypothetical protein